MISLPLGKPLVPGWLPASAKLVDLDSSRTDGFDIADAFSAATTDELREQAKRAVAAMLKLTPLYDPTVERPASEEAPPAGLAFEELEAFAAVEEPDSEPLIADSAGKPWMPAGGTAMVYGSGGAGKTTLVADLVITVAQGDPWCGLLTPTRPLRTLLIENEGPRPPLRVKLRERLHASPGGTAGRVLVMTEPWQAFTFRNDTTRAELVRVLDAHDADLLVVGPLGRVGMQGGGTLDEITAFMALVTEVQNAAKRRPAVLIVHHENRAGQVSGAWDGATDVLVHISGEGHGRTRVYWQKLRFGSVLHATTTHLLWVAHETFTVAEKPEISEDTMTDEMLAAALELPGGSWTQIRAKVTGRVEEVAAIRDRLIADGRLINGGTASGFKLYNANDPAAPRSQPGTASERGLFALPGESTAPSRSPVPAYRGNGERNGTDEEGAA